ncbi:MAG: cytochrome ubiquinol oxidase subunit I, partial [Bryobacteraceae bacterium]
MATTIDYPLPKPAPSPAEFSFSQALWKWVATVDAKRLGIMYTGTAFIFMLIGGCLAMVIRAQLMFPNNDV